MKKREREKEIWVMLVLIISILIMIPSVLASIDGINILVKNNSISGGDMIKGNVQIKITNELPALNISSNFGGSLTLIEWLKRNGLTEGNDYSCTTKNCSSAMVARSALSSAIALDNEVKAIGFNLSGEDIVIQSLRLGVSSNAGQSCNGQLSTDLLDGNVSMINTKYVNTLCDVKQIGCFSSGVPVEVAEITSNAQNPYCENITLPAGPAYRLSALVTNSTIAYSELTLTLYDSNWGSVDSCILPKHTQHTEELSCVVNASRATKQSYMLCLGSKPGTLSNYTISTETSSPVCGTSQRNSLTFSRDYPLSAQPLTFAQPSFEINESSVNLMTGKSLINLVNTYLNKVYGNNCTNGCALPFIIKSALNQQVSFSISELKYTSKGASLTNNNLLSLENVQPTISSGKINLTLDSANFTIPLGTKETSFVLYSGTNKIFAPVPLSIKAGFNFDVYPSSVSIGLSTLFNIGGDYNMSQSVWKFGDGNIQTIKGKALYYTYKKAGNFTLEVTATRSDGLTGTKSFIVEVGNANSSAKILLPHTQQRINNLSILVSKLPSWKGGQIEKKINITGLKSNINNLQKLYDSAISDENYTSVVEGIMKLNIPSSVIPTTTNEDTLLIGIINANLKYLANLSGVSEESLGDGENIKRALTDWTGNSYNAQAKREIYSSVSRGEETELVTFYTIAITKIAENASNAYFVLDAPLDQISFENPVGAREISVGSSKGTIIPISSDTTFSFTLPESAELSSLGAYLTPELKYLGLVQTKVDPPNLYDRWGIAKYGILFVVLGFFVLYIILQEWYKHHYESHLFANSDDLYNVVHFIYNARSQKLTDGDARKKLTFSGWNNEQVTYAFKKIDGKRTGMLEIPIFKFFENRKVRKEIEKRRQETVDARFIKRPNL